MRSQFFAVALTAATASVPAQSIDFTLDRVLTAPRSLVPSLPTAAWITNTEAFSIIQRSGDEEVVLRVPMRPNPQPEELFRASALKDALDEDVLSNTVLPPFSWLDAHTLRIVIGRKVFHWDLRKAEPHHSIAPPEGTTVHVYAPGDRRVAAIAHGDLVLRQDDSTLRRITWDGRAEDIVYGGAAHRSEFGITSGLWWDPTGRFLAFSREDMRPIAPYPFVDYTTRPATPKHGRYPMAGSTHSKVTIGIVDARDGSLRYLEHDSDRDLYWTNVSFSPDGTRVFVAFVNRGQDRAELVEFDPLSGKRGRTLLTETDAKWVEPEMGPIFPPQDSDGRFLWFSPRDGYRNLYVYSADGTFERQLTHARFDVRSFGGFTRDGTSCYVTGSGDNPLEMHLFRVELATGAMTRVTPDGGEHFCMVSDDDHILDTTRSASNPGTLVLRPNGHEPLTIVRAVDPLAGQDIGEGEFFTVKASDGTPLHGYVLKPPGFDPSSRYPLIHYVYGGPHSQLVRDTWGRGAILWLRWMCSQGYLVSCVDNRGTDNRGIAFAQAIHRNVGTPEVEDQLAAIDALIARGFVDEDRIGVHGWSYGGYMTIRLMELAPKRFAAGVAGAPPTDWSRYETGYTERYMDTPQENPEGYARASCLPLVDRIEGRLLLVSPSDDHIVMPSHSVAFLQACIDSGVLIDHMSYPMQQHGLRGKHRQHFTRLMTRHFHDHLGKPSAR